jgi:chromosomal replication initiation ATPase DnaA
MYLLRVVGRSQFAEIGGLFGRDGSTVAHACAAVEDRRDSPEYEALVLRLEAEFDPRLVEPSEVRYAQG